MKTKSLFQIPLILLLVTLIACQSEEPNPNSFPEIGETSGNYIACRIDGADYVSMAFESYTTRKMIGTLISNNGKSLYSFINYYQDNARNANFEIRLKQAPIVNQRVKLTSISNINALESSQTAHFHYSFTGTLNVIDTISQSGVSDSYITNSVQKFQTTNSEIGEITFTLIDTVNQIYQGTFWADLKFYKWDTKGQPEPWPNKEDYWNLVAQRTNIDTSRVIRVRDGRFYFNAAKSDLRIDRR